METPRLALVQEIRIQQLTESLIESSAANKNERERGRRGFVHEGIGIEDDDWIRRKKRETKLSSSQVSFSFLPSEFALQPSYNLLSLYRTTRTSRTVLSVIHLSLAGELWLLQLSDQTFQSLSVLELPPPSSESTGSPPLQRQIKKAIGN